MKIGEKIKVIRELKNYTQQYMSDQLSIPQSSYSRLEKDGSDISFGKLEAIAALFNMQVEDLINFNENIFLKMGAKKMETGNGSLSTGEKKLYGEFIEALKNENTYLKTMIDKLLGKKQLTKKIKSS